MLAATGRSQIPCGEGEWCFLEMASRNDHESTIGRWECQPELPHLNTLREDCPQVFVDLEMLPEE